MEKRVVIKVGSGLIVNQGNLNFRFAFLHGLMSDIADLRQEGYQVVLTSSGAAAIGLGAMGLRPESSGVQDKQAAAACGQPLVMNMYKQIALEFDMEIAQVLLTSEDMENRRRYLNTKNTLEKLLERGILPIINENDTVTTEEIRVGDNDRLAAKISQMCRAQDFVMLTDIDGLYDRPPGQPGAKFVEEVEDVSVYLDATKSKGTLGSGGMLTKMQAANMAQNAGATAYIGRGIIESPVSSILKKERRHTRCIAIGDPQSSWRVWLTDRLQMAGTLTVSNEAAVQLRKGGRGIRTTDVITCIGEYNKGDVLHIYDEDGIELGRGLTNFSSKETLLLARFPEDEVASVLGYHSESDLIAADNLALLTEHHLPWDQPVDHETEVSVRI